MNTDEEAEEAKDTEEAEDYWSEVTDIIKMAQRKLIKPFVTLLSFKPGDRIGLNILNESHWQTLVIFPFKNHWKAYFKDPCFDGQLLSSKLKDKFRNLFINIEFIGEELSNVIQTKNYYDCGWWCLFNACMLILRGGNDFFNKFDYKK